jgi:hypothetical protein
VSPLGQTLEGKGWLIRCAGLSDKEIEDKVTGLVKTGI